MAASSPNQPLPPHRHHIRRVAKARYGAPTNHDRWMVSYADFVTLLFAFFTTLYAISKVDAAKLTTMVESMQQAFENVDANTIARRNNMFPNKGGLKSGEVNVPDSEVSARLKKRLSQEVQDGRVSLEVDARGVVISLQESGSFPVGSSDLTPEARTILSEIASTLSDIHNTVRVEGHTDDVPIHTSRFASNWELSTARATSVVQYLIASTGVPASRLSASGYGEFHPRVANDSSENRTRNRRVDVVVLNSVTRASEEPPPATLPSRPETPREQRD